MSFDKRKRTTEAQKKPNLHAFIATPAYDGRVLTDYSQALAETCQVATLMGIGVTACVMGNGAFIDLARNIFVRLFLEKKECTHLFFIDADLSWEARAFVGLMQANKPVCAGAYPKRQSPEEYPVRFVNPPGGKGLVMQDGWIMCDRVATGFLCIERSVVERMAAAAPKIIDKNPHHPQPDTPQLFYTYRQDDGRFVGEDFAWCKDYCEQSGEHIWVYPDFDFTHNRTYKGNWHEFLNREAEAYLRDHPEEDDRLRPESSAA